MSLVIHLLATLKPAPAADPPGGGFVVVAHATPAARSTHRDLGNIVRGGTPVGPREFRHLRGEDGCGAQLLALLGRRGGARAHEWEIEKWGAPGGMARTLLTEEAGWTRVDYGAPR